MGGDISELNLMAGNSMSKMEKNKNSIKPMGGAQGMRGSVG